MPKPDLDKLFNSVSLNKRTSWKLIARRRGVSSRTIRDWKNGNITIPWGQYNFFLSLAKITKEDLRANVVEDLWHIKEAARKGGHARTRLYGNLGTPEGRKKGGLASLVTHARGNTGFKILRQIVEPNESDNLAEFMGILLGDGHLSVFQVSIATNSKTDMKHAMFISGLFRKLFHLPATVTKRKKMNAVIVVTSSKSLVNFLNKKGMPIGDKIKHGLSVPSWISKNLSFQKAFIRGLFDTDGCIYLDKHKIKGRLYKHLGWAITSYAPFLVKGVIQILTNFGFRPTYRTSQKSVFLRRGDDILRYFSVIGTSNEKHRQRFQSFVDISKGA